MGQKLIELLAALIPSLAGNGVVVAAFDLLRFLGQFFSGIRNQEGTGNRIHNDAMYYELAQGFAETKGFIENQNSLRNLRYGNTTICAGGCEIIAAFNAIYDLTGRHAVSLPALISAFEREGMVMGGHLGTSPRSVAAFFRKHGFYTTFSTDADAFNTIAEQADTMILTMYNNRSNLLDQVHAVCITRQGGKLYAHNVAGDGSVFGPYGSVSELLRNINGGKAKGISLVAMRKKNGKHIKSGTV